MKKLIIILSLMISGSAFAQTYFQQCKDPAGNVIVCAMGSSPSSNSLLPEASGLDTSGMGMPTAPNLNLQAPQINVQGSYDSRVPGGNVFLFCSEPRPPKHTDRRKIYDQICPKGRMPQQ